MTPEEAKALLADLDEALRPDRFTPNITRRTTNCRVCGNSARELHSLTCAYTVTEKNLKEAPVAH